MGSTIVNSSSPATVVQTRWDASAGKIQALADAFSEHDYDYRPTPEVRSVGEVVRHVAFWHEYLAGVANGRNPDGAMNELSREKYSTKAAMLDAMSRSAADVTTTLATHASDLSPELLESVVSFIEHTSEHYGQLVVCARMKGIVPPASRS